MRIRFIVILLISMFLILISSIIISYKAIEETQKNIRENLLNRVLTEYKNNSEIKKSIEIYLAFSRKQAVEITRNSLKYYLIVVLIMSILFIFSIFSITKPIKELSKRVNNILREGKISGHISETTFKARGSYEVKQLYLSFDRLIRDLKEYEELVGDRERYRGWKEIARIIVHEINNLISPIETYSGYIFEKLAKEPEKSEVLGGFNFIESNSGTMEIEWEGVLNSQIKGKVEAILLKIEEIKTTLSKFRDLAHLPEPRYQRVNLATLLKNITNEFEGTELVLPQRAYINNKPYYPDTTANLVVNTDPILLGEILRNLIKNATESTLDILRASPQNSAHLLETKTSQHEKVVVKLQQNPDNIIVEITDRGGGIPKEIQGKIFTPGFSTKEGNIGIGLSIVKSLSEQLGIKIEMESIEGKGTTFYIIFPKHIPK